MLKYVAEFITCEEYISCMQSWFYEQGTIVYFRMKLQQTDG